MPYADPDKQRAYKREWARMGRAGESGTPCGTPVPVAFRLQTAQGVIDLLQEQVEAVRADQEVGTVERARAVGYLASVSLRAIEAGNLAARVEAMEAVLKQRNGKR